MEELTKVLEKTKTFINNSKNIYEVAEYRQFIKKAVKSNCLGIQVLGKLMMALAVAVVGVGISLAATGIGALPAVAVGAAGSGLFSGGAHLNNKGKDADEALITQFSQS